MALNETISGMERFIAAVDEKGVLSERFAGFLDAITLQVNQNTILSGTGSPEGVITAQPYRKYIDTTADVEYYKKTGAGSTGWVAL